MHVLSVKTCHREWRSSALRVVCFAGLLHCDAAGNGVFSLELVTAYGTHLFYPCHGCNLRAAAELSSSLMKMIPASPLAADLCWVAGDLPSMGISTVDVQ